MALTLEQAKTLGWGDYVHTPAYSNADGSPQRWRVSGKVKIWKTRPNEVKVPIKHGMRDSSYITQNDLQEFEMGYGS